MIIKALSFGLIFISLIGILIALIGFVKFKDFNCRQHVAGIIDSAMVPVALIALSLLQNHYVSSLKLIIITLLVLILNPLSTHLLAKINKTIDNNKTDNKIS